ncbi:MAG: cytochrome C, partial [bacterium]
MRTKISNILLVIFLMWAPGMLIAQLSPGDLAEVHAHLEGLSNCTKCHVLNQKVSNEKCLDCHKMLNNRISQGKGYHASSEISGRDCISCHSDHHGRKFEMIRFDTASFDHRLTGYLLEGAHMNVACSQCHRDEHISDPEIRKRKRSYLGLQTECLSCHEDYHNGTLASNCLECHTPSTFEQAPRFDHDQAAFPLKGKHREVACEKCHPRAEPDGTGGMKFKGLSFTQCTDCHKDVHQGKFGSDCKNCHTEDSFHMIIGMNRFDHSKTGYPLEGKHQFVTCEKCHTSGYSTPMKHGRCMDCHDDYHESQFRKDNILPDCADCHTLDGFQPSLYTVEDHLKNQFPLEGAHLATPCFSCHKKQEKWQFRDIGIRCVDCHEDIHQPYLSRKYYPEQNCKSCHSLESWKQIGFDHNQT